MEQALTTVDNNVSTQGSPIEMLMSAVDKGFNLDNLDRMLELQAKWEEREARKAYHEAMAAFKADPPKIEKDKHVSYSTTKGKTEYDHASLANICEKVAASLSKHGLSAAWATSQQERAITVTCTITHRHGHSESTSLSAGPDDSGGKNSIQAIGSTISYLERYTLLALTGLATHDMDDDGKGAEPVEYITPEQVREVRFRINKTKSDEVAFCKHFKLESVEKIPAHAFNTVKAALVKKEDEMNFPCPNKDGKETATGAECRECKNREGCPSHEVPQ